MTNENKSWNDMTPQEKKVRWYSLALVFLVLSSSVLTFSISEYAFPPERQSFIQFILGVIGDSAILIASVYVLNKNNILKE